MNYSGNWIPTTTLDQMVDINYDVVIVGSGFGGGAALYRLCQLWKSDGTKRIALIEKGDKLFHSHALNIPTMNVTRMRSYLFPSNSTNEGEYLPNFAGARMVYALGGRSLFWDGGSPRPPIFELRKWPIHPTELEVYFSIAEKVMNVTTSYARGASMQDILLKRLQARGIIDVEDYPLAIDMNNSRLGENHSNAWFSSISFLSYGINKKSFDLAINSNVSRVLIEKGKVDGVEVYSPDKKSHVIRAKQVILSASAIETPRILLNSGIYGNSIGKYLTGHSSMFGFGKINRKEFGNILGNLSIYKQETVKHPYQIQIVGPGQYFSYQPFEENIYTEEASVTEAAYGRVESRADNKVYLDSNRKDEYGIPLIQVDYSYTKKDYEVIKLMEQGIANSAVAMGVTLDENRPMLRLPGSDMHESCTCRMGYDPETSSTDVHGQIHGVPGLYVADNSVLPTLSAANPALSNVALAIRLADYIVSHTV